MPAPGDPAQPTPAACPRCHQPLTFRLACAACGALFAEPQLDAFAQLGLPAAYALDEKRLNDHYLTVSRLAHPDRHVVAGEAAQDHAEAVMALANRARATLLDYRSRAEALILRLSADAGLKPPAKRQPPADFLMEIMDTTEQVAQANDGEKAALLDNIRGRIAALEADLAKGFSVLPPADAVATCARARDLLDRLAYWHRLQENATGAGEHKLVS